MSGRFSWNGFSEILATDLFDDNLLESDRNGCFESTESNSLLPRVRACCSS